MSNKDMADITSSIMLAFASYTAMFEDMPVPPDLSADQKALWEAWKQAQPDYFYQFIATKGFLNQKFNPRRNQIISDWKAKMSARFGGRN